MTHNQMAYAAIVSTLIFGTLFVGATGFFQTGSDFDPAVDDDLIGDGTDPTDAIACMNYISGVVDTSSLVCPPMTVTRGQLKDIVTKYLKEKPATRHWSATLLVQDSLVAVFPCNK